VLVPPREPPALAAALLRLMRDPALRARMGAAALQHAQRSFGIDAMIDAMESVFASVARGSR